MLDLGVSDSGFNPMLPRRAIRIEMYLNSLFPRAVNGGDENRRFELGEQSTGSEERYDGSR